jgi:hypothetical protein
MTLKALKHLLHETGRIPAATVRERIDALPIPVEPKPGLLANFKTAMGDC